MTTAPLHEFPTPARIARQIRLFARQFPVTISFMLLSAMLFLLTLIAGGESTESQSRNWGAISTLSFFREVEPQIWKNVTPELYGPFELWKGEWWRLLVTGFHHGDPVHLTLNLMVLAFLGPLVEQRLGKISFSLFFIFSTVFSVCAELFWGENVVGISGGLFALLGYLVIARLRDEELARQLPDERWIFYLLMAAVMAGLSALEILNIGNTAHVSGLLVGVAWAVINPWSKSWRMVFIATAFVLLVAAGYGAVHPFWLGRYHWYLSRLDKQDSAACLQGLRRAISYDPRLPGAWIELAERQQASQQPMDAWKTLLEGILINRNSLELLEVTSQQWGLLKRLHLEPLATEIAVQILGEDSPIWLKQFDEHLARNSLGPSMEDDLQDWSQQNPDSWLRSPLIELVRPKSVEPHKPSGLPDDSPNSAGEGTTL
ncbi:rhomboid family intramembrane serine protease [Planctopirus hydrillae]|uniref:Peptidase S54 rhomboid domain-containing protein n=1 Tax=Planctopirus hydrillae TaxID=1841610 RepID=A0A1C3EKF7_9PLAN|nr:rhomboid family intramembrane serine protease [Planctopirus hydrillae]ODA33726.1 hypothetical protein A6X21_18540 [Planctopirus hydrillae]